MSCQSCQVFAVVTLGFFLNGLLAFDDVKIKVPQAVVRGKVAELQCLFDLEQDQLYSVKWYRRGHEFFRYTPEDLEPMKIFALDGINVRRSESRPTNIVLQNVSREISGPFSCEVTAERPSFFTVMQTAELQVVDIPLEEPYITGIKSRYSIEDEIFQANCTCSHSYPPANITWYINGLQIRAPHVMKRTYTINKNYFTVVSSIRHRLTKKLFPNGRMKLRCSASMYDVYHKSTEVSVELSDRKRNKHHGIEWPPSTRAPPSENEYYDNEDYENSIEAPPETTLWFWTPYGGATNLTFSIPMLVLSLLQAIYTMFFS